MTSVALIVHACDRYQLLYTGFEYFFKKYWPLQDLKIKYYFFTEEADFVSPVFTTIKTGKGEWSERLRKGLKQIPESHIIYFQEDIWLIKPVDAHTLTEIIQTALSQKINLIKLSGSSMYQTKPTGTSINGLSVAVLDNQRSQYLMSHRVSLWDKSFFIAQLKYKEHPWRNERKGTQRLRKINPLIYQIDFFKENGEAPNNVNSSLDRASQYFTVSQNAKFNNHVLDFTQVIKADQDASVSAYAKKLEYNFYNGITHDGLPTPRKDDIFKKMKNLFLAKKKTVSAKFLK